jgi:hypothetical protein
MMIFLVFMVFAGKLHPQDNNNKLSKFLIRRTAKLKEISDFDNWPGRTSAHKMAFRITEGVLGEKWSSFLSSRTQAHGISGVMNTRYYLQKDSSRLRITMYVASKGIIDVHEQIIWRHANSSATNDILKNLLTIKRSGLGDFYVEGPPYNSVVFARNNILVRIEGDHVKPEQVMNIAKKIDQQIQAQPEAKESDYPQLELLSASEIHIAKDEKSTIQLKRGNAECPVTVYKVPPTSGVAYVMSDDIGGKKNQVNIVVQGFAAGSARFDFIIHDPKTFLCSVQSVTVVVGDGQTPEEQPKEPGDEQQESEPNKKEAKPEEPKTPSEPNSQSNREETNPDQGTQIEKTPAPAEEGESEVKPVPVETGPGGGLLTIILIVLGLVIAGLVVFLLLRGRR